MEKYLWLFFTILGLSSGNLFSKNEKGLGFGPLSFEDKIQDALDDLKDFIKNGNSDIDPFDPYFSVNQNVNISLNDTKLTGYFRSLTISGLSSFEPLKIDLRLFPLQFKLQLFFPGLLTEGEYELVGSILGKFPLNGTGRFISETQNITLTFFLKPSTAHSIFQISDLELKFDVGGTKVFYTNELESEQLQQLDENLSLRVIDEIQVKYFPSLINTFKLSANNFLLKFSLENVMNLIFGFLI